MGEISMTINDTAEQALDALNLNCYIHTNDYTEDAYKDGFIDGANYGYKEVIKQAKEWLFGHINTDVEYDKNGEPLAISYIEGRKLTIEMATEFETDMNKLLKEKKMKKSITIDWNDNSIHYDINESKITTIEVIGVLEYIKLLLFSNREPKEKAEEV